MNATFDCTLLDSPASDISFVNSSTHVIEFTCPAPSLLSTTTAHSFMEDTGELGCCCKRPNPNYQTVPHPLKQYTHKKPHHNRIIFTKNTKNRRIALFPTNLLVWQTEIAKYTQAS